MRNEKKNLFDRYNCNNKYNSKKKYKKDNIALTIKIK